MTTTATKQMITHSQRAPQTNPIDLAKQQIIHAFDRVDWTGQREWQAFDLSEEFTHEKGEFIRHAMLDSLKDRIRGHYQRQGKRVQVIWQATVESGSLTGYTLFVKQR